MSDRPAFLASAKDPIFNDMVWVPANEKFGHMVRYRKEWSLDDKAPFDMRFSLGRVSTVADLIRMLFHGDQYRRPEDFTGLASFYGALDRSKAQNAVNVVDGGGKENKENLESIYLVNWSGDTAFMAYQVDEAGELHAALVPKDWRYIVRVANVDENTDKPLAMTKALLRLPTLGSSAAFYMRSPFAEEYRGVPIRAVGALHRREKRVI